MIIYLAGYVPKTREEQDNYKDWRKEYSRILEAELDATCIDPFEPGRDESALMKIFGKDCKHIRDCDLVIVNGEKNIGVGTSQEMVIAKYFGKPVVVVLPEGCKNRCKEKVFSDQTVKNWIHPFVYAFSDHMIDRIEDIATIKDKIFTDVKKISIIDDAIRQINRQTGHHQ